MVVELRYHRCMQDADTSRSPEWNRTSDTTPGSALQRIAWGEKRETRGKRNGTIKAQYVQRLISPRRAGQDGETYNVINIVCSPFGSALINILQYPIPRPRLTTLGSSKSSSCSSPLPSSSQLSAWEAQLWLLPSQKPRPSTRPPNTAGMAALQVFS